MSNLINIISNLNNIISNLTANVKSACQFFFRPLQMGYQQIKRNKLSLGTHTKCLKKKFLPQKVELHFFQSTARWALTSSFSLKLAFEHLSRACFDDP